jgi:hypothetical protein
MNEASYIKGQRQTWSSLLAQCIRELGYELGTETELAKLIVEREEAVSQLRRICEDHGDNDWDETLHMADIVDKHLGKHLY